MDKIHLIIIKVYSNSSDNAVNSYELRISDLYDSIMPEDEVDTLIRDLVIKIKLLERRARNAKKHKRMGTTKTGLSKQHA